MNKRGYILILLLTLLVGVLFGQDQGPGSLTYDAYDLYTKGEYQKAAELIDRAVFETEDSTNVESWYLRSGIYFDIFTKIDKRNALSDSRVVSLISVIKSIELDVEKIYFKQSLVILDHLSISYFNDAVTATINLDLNDPKFAENSYLEYKRIQKLAFPDKNFDESDIKFYLAEATSFAREYQKDPDKNKDLFNLTIESLAKVLKIDSNNYSANYNTAIYYYNEGVYQIETIDTSTDVNKLVLIQEYSVKQFKLAEPYMLKANKIRTREETLKGLRGIYNVLWDEEKFQFYTEELEKLKQKNLPVENGIDK